MSHEIVSPAYKTKLGNLVAKSVLVLLADASSTDGFCWPSSNYIADRTEISKRSVLRVIQLFQEILLISRVTRNEDKTRCGYQLNLDLLGTDLVKEYAAASAKIRDGECPTDTPEQSVPRTQKVSHGHKKCPTDTKSVPRTQPPHPLKGGTVKNHKEPPENHQENLPDKDVQGDEIPKWIPMDAWNGWLENRRKKKSPVTGRSRTIALNKLAKWLEDGYDLTVILDAATFANWQGLYLPKGEDGAPIRPEKPKRKYVAGDPNNADDWVRACFDPDTGIHYDPITNPPPPARA